MVLVSCKPFVDDFHFFCALRCTSGAEACHNCLQPRQLVALADELLHFRAFLHDSEWGRNRSTLDAALHELHRLRCRPALVVAVERKNCLASRWLVLALLLF